ncbi:MAG TPA: sulfotransferase, partial [Candidatus Eisenbacteria bacterium]|nr:sulfotransferase [Candidatus Eisenbacteria bacterium]
ETLEQAELEFEGARYVHLCRHPLGMIGSFVEARNDQVFFRHEHPYTVRELGELVWIVCHRNIQAFLEGVPGDRWCLLRYEDLTADPERGMRRVCELLGLDLDPEMLRPYANQEWKMTDGIHPMSRMLGDVKFHEHRDIDPAVAHGWRARSPDRLSALAARLAEALGYAVEAQHVG